MAPGGFKTEASAKSVFAAPDAMARSEAPPAEGMMMPGAAAAPPAAPSPNQAASAPADTTPPKAVPRKIIYNGDVELTVDDFAKAEQGIARLVKEYDGYLADSSVGGTSATSGSAGPPRPIATTTTSRSRPSSRAT